MNSISRKTRNIFIFFVLVSVVGFLSLAQGMEQSSAQPQEITADISCGKCGMYPEKYPKWQTQIIFNDGSMQPFDGCKCMFGYLFNMGEYDKTHKGEDVSAIWVREFNSGDWINAKTAHYVIGSSKMGPMGKELIPFSDAAAAESFQKANGGQIAMYDDITMGTLKPLMGKMHMNGGKMGGHMDMEGKKKGHMDM